MMRVVLAVPTIEQRRHRRPQIDQLWHERTPDANLEIIYSEAGTTWAAGLNDIYEQTRANPPDVWVAGSDDMVPADERWLPAALHWLDQDCYPAPMVEDPRFTNWGGFLWPVEDGTPGDMSTFPILRRGWLRTVFPLPEDLHYFSDNLAAVRLMVAGVRTVAVPSCRILHLHAAEGRGAGYQSENTRLHIDTVRYSRALEQLGVDRATLPPNLRGGLWEPHFHEIGTLMGA